MDRPIRIEQARNANAIAAAIYARISSPKNHSVEAQVTDCRARCAQKGWPVRYVLTDVDMSGANPDRPGLNRLLEHIAAGHVTHVVTWKFDRLARTIRQAAEIAEFLKEQGVDYHSVTEPFDTSTVYGRYMFGNLASAAQLERELNQERMFAALGHKARRGEWTRGQIPFGYRLAKARKLRQHPAEAKQVLECFTLYLDLKSYSEVAAALNRNGQQYRGRRWTTALVKRILEKPIYGGRYQMSGEWFDRPSLAIVPPEVFAQAGELRKRNERNGKPASVLAREAAIENVFSQYVSTLQDEPEEQP